MSLRHILFATGGFDGTRRVADVSAALAKPANARLSIVTVGQDTPEEEESGVLARTRRNVERAVNPDEILQNAKERAQHNSVLDVGVQLERVIQRR